MLNADADREAESDSGPRDRGTGVERLCVATRTVKPIAEMIRFVVAPDGAVVPDVKRKLPGRGVWVTASAEAVGKAVARNSFARGFKRPVQAAADLKATTEALLEQAALDSLAIAHKAGLVRAGFAKAEAAVSHGEAVALLHAKEAASDGLRKLAAAVKRASGDAAVPILGAFTTAQLDLALGRSNVVHAALLAGSASEGFLARYRTLETFRGCDPVNTFARRSG